MIMIIYIAIAEVMGIMMVGLGLSILFNKKTVMSVLEEATRSLGQLWTWGLVTLVMGAVVVTLNNVWSSGLQLLVTILGWLMLIKGLYIVILPNLAASMYKKANKGAVMIIAGLILLVLGLVLLY